MTKRLSTALLVVLAIAIMYTISISFSYWAAIERYVDVYIVIDTIHEAELTVDLKEDKSNINKKLVPAGYVYSSDEVDEIIFTFELDINGEELQPGIELNLTIQAKNILINGDPTYSYLVEIILPNEGNLLIGNDSLLVVVKVRLTEPETREIAEAIRGKNITFDLLFNVVS
ncbi:MAG TPA: hypothetical protein VK005_00955 [Acholeplasma sp.]|nr:hypothetical protein [Acholeplasma sp.]